jgi:hypothetical protein
MTGIAVGDGIDILDDLVLDFQMALIAFYFIFENMFGVHQIGVFVFFQSFPFTVTLVAILSRNLPISENGVAVTLLTRKSVVENKGVIVTRGLGANKAFLCMTMVAVIDLRIMLAFLEVTDKAGTLRDRDVFSLHDLGVAAGALEFFSSFEVFEVDFVIEGNLVELHLSFQKPFVVAAFSQAAFVLYFSPWLGFDVKFCPVAPDHDQTLDFFPQLGLDSSAGGIVAHAAFEFTVGRSFPAFEIGLHEVAGSAKVRMGSEFDRPQSDHQKKCEKTEEYNQSFFLFFRFFHELILEINKISDRLNMLSYCIINYRVFHA